MMALLQVVIGMLTVAAVVMMAFSLVQFLTELRGPWWRKRKPLTRKD